MTSPSRPLALVLVGATGTVGRTVLEVLDELDVPVRSLRALAAACAEQVVVPGTGCCGFAGDKGFTTPELNASALRDLRAAVQGCERGYSNSRGCEIGLTSHSGIPYQSIAHLVDACTAPRTS